jgi:hypothetical protein
VLSASLRPLPVGERGWIELSEARALFSRADDHYAFGQMDDGGRASLAAFAARSEHRCTFDFMPAEGRLYFSRRHSGPEGGSRVLLGNSPASAGETRPRGARQLAHPHARPPSLPPARLQYAS